MDQRVAVRSAGGRLVAIKTATGGPEGAQLAREAQLLRRCSHPGVVAVISFTAESDRAELVMTAPSEHTVADQLPETMRDCLDLVAAIADTVADLHAMGVAHCALRPDHILVASRTQPVLCGFGNAQSVVDPRLFSADVVATGDLLAWLVRRMPTDQRNARRAAAVVARSRQPGATARELAFALADGHRGSQRLPDTIVAKRPVLVALLALGAIATGAALFADDGASPSAASVATSITVPQATGLVAPDAPMVQIDGVSYRVGQSGDLAYFVPCPDEQRVVVLRPDTGDIFIFDHLAEPGAPRTAQSVGRIAGALEIVPSEDETCSELGVVTDDAVLRIPVPTSKGSTR